MVKADCLLRGLTQEDSVLGIEHSISKRAPSFDGFYCHRVETRISRESRQSGGDDSFADSRVGSRDEESFFAEQWD
jgi:hypothetical protein